MGLWGGLINYEAPALSPSIKKEVSVFLHLASGGFEDVDAVVFGCLDGGVGVPGDAPRCGSAASGAPMPPLRADPLLHAAGAEAPVRGGGHDGCVRLLPRLRQGGGGDLRGDVGLSGQV